MAKTPREPIYRAVVNGEGHYSIWEEPKPLPPGWNLAGFAGTREEVLAWMEQRWEEIRPRN